MVSITSNLRWVRRVRKGLASLGDGQSAVDRVACGASTSSDVSSRGDCPRRPLGPEYADVFARIARYAAWELWHAVELARSRTADEGACPASQRARRESHQNAGDIPFSAAHDAARASQNFPRI